jgi:tetratricopeptide (TPR) repeat protein
MNSVQTVVQNQTDEMTKRVSAALRTGDFVEAREYLSELWATATDPLLRIRIRNNQAIIERESGRLYNALQYQIEAGFLTGENTPPLYVGKSRKGLGITWEMIFEREQQDEHADRALMAYEDACVYFERAEAIRELASTKNCIAYLFIQLNKLDEALKYSGLAIQIAKPLDDDALIAQFEHTRAQAFLKSGCLDQALMIASHAASVLRAKKYQVALAEVLETIEKITARMREEVEAI